MSMVVGLSGAQGGGKTTLLEGLKKRGWVVDDFKVSREVQKQLGVSSLTKATEEPYSMMLFQEKILQVKRQRELENKSGTEPLVLVERTFADILAYATSWTWDLIDQRRWGAKDALPWLVEYTRKCMSAQQECYSGLLLLPLMLHVVWQDDAHRAPKQTADFIFEAIQSFNQTYSRQPAPSLLISAEGVEDRVEQVDKFLRTLI